MAKIRLERIMGTLSNVVTVGMAIYAATVNYPSVWWTLILALALACAFTYLFIIFFVHPDSIVGLKSTLISFVSVTFDARVSHENVNITYKRKMRILLRNDSAQPLEIGRPDWLTTSKQAQLQPEFGYQYQLEQGSGGAQQGAWHKETQEITVPSGGQFRIWIGLCPDYEDAALNAKRDRKELGTLVLPVKIGDKTREARITV